MTEIGKEPLAYARGDQIPRRRIVSVPAVIISGAGVLSATLILVLVEPIFEKDYKNFAMFLPSWEMWVVDLSQAMRWLHWGILWAIPLVLGLVTPLVTRRRTMEVEAGRVRGLFLWNVALAAVLVALVVAVGLIVPLVMPYIRYVHSYLK